MGQAEREGRGAIHGADPDRHRCSGQGDSGQLFIWRCLFCLPLSDYIGRIRWRQVHPDAGANRPVRLGCTYQLQRRAVADHTAGRRRPGKRGTQRQHHTGAGRQTGPIHLQRCNGVGRFAGAVRAVPRRHHSRHLANRPGSRRQRVAISYHSWRFVGRKCAGGVAVVGHGRPGHVRHPWAHGGLWSAR